MTPFPGMTLPPLRALPAALLAALVAALLAVLAGPAAPARALSCVEPETVLADADRVVSGRVADVRDGWVLVRVDEVWRGTARRDHWVRLDGELSSWFPFSRDGEPQEGWTSGRQRWVLAVLPDNATVNPCTMWELAQVRDLRPARVTDPLPGSTEAPPESSYAVPVALGAGAVGLLGLGLGAWWARRRRQSAPGEPAQPAAP